MNLVKKDHPATYMHEKMNTDFGEMPAIRCLIAAKSLLAALNKLP